MAQDEQYPWRWQRCATSQKQKASKQRGFYERKKQPIMSMGFINFWHLLHFKDVSFVTHGGSIFKKKTNKRDGSHLGWIAVSIFISATDAFKLRKHLSFISEYACVNGSKKKGGGGTVGMGETLVKNSMTTPNGDSREGKFPKNGRFFGIFSAVFCVCCLSKKMAVFIKGRVKKTNQ